MGMEALSAGIPGSGNQEAPYMELAAQTWRARMWVLFYFVQPEFQGRGMNYDSGKKPRWV